MAIDKFYIIENNIVTNLALYEESVAAKLGLKRHPIETPFGNVSTNWTYLPKEDTFLPPPRDILYEWDMIRSARDMYLHESDVFVLPDRWASYTQDEKYAWSTYRQALRDIPQKFIDPKEVVWPEKPIVEAIAEFKPSEPIDPAV